MKYTFWIRRSCKQYRILVLAYPCVFLVMILIAGLKMWVALTASGWCSIYLLYSTIGRLRDIEANPWWVVLLFIPFVNIVFSIVLGFIPGNPGTNKYGPSPIVFFARHRELMKKGYSIKKAAETIFAETNYPEETV